MKMINREVDDERSSRASMLALVRIRTIDREIAAQKMPTCAQLAKLMEVSERTVKRDISLMRDQFNAPIIYDKAKRGFRYAELGWSLPLEKLTEGELIIFFVAESALRFTGRTAEAVLLKSAIGKLTSMLPDPVTINLSTLSENASFQNLPNVASDMKMLEQLAKASISQETVEFDYFSQHKGERKRRTADIHLMHNFAGDWYAVSWDHKAKGFRDFHTGRISNLKMTGKGFEKQPGWRKEDYLNEGFFMTRGGRMTTVSILFDSYQARWMRERGSFHPNEIREDLPDGSLRLSFKVGENGLEAVARFCMTYAGNCIAEKPQKLRQLIKEKAKLAAQLHRTQRVK